MWVRAFSIIPRNRIEKRVHTLVNGILSGSRTSLSQAITLVESSNPEHQEQAEVLLNKILSENPKGKMSSLRIGIAGPPGAGKSTLIEALGSLLTQKNHRLAVLAIDPSSQRSRGSILGDKTRMPQLSVNPLAYVRPSPNRGTLGGLAQHTNDIVLLCEACGYDIILIESVGLGQSETVIDEAVDMVLLLVPPNGGDELQGSKKGIVEVADLIVVNKADGNFRSAAKHTLVEYRNALELIRKKNANWTPAVLSCSALENIGLQNVWKTIKEFQATMVKTGQLQMKRDEQSSKWMWSELQMELNARVMRDPLTREKALKLKESLASGRMSPRSAAKVLLKEFMKLKTD